MGAQYTATVLVRTTYGESPPSPALLVATPWEKTELQQFRESLDLQQLRKQVACLQRQAVASEPVCGSGAMSHTPSPILGLDQWVPDQLMIYFQESLGSG